MEPRGDLLVGVAGGEFVQHLQLAVAQAERPNTRFHMAAPLPKSTASPWLPASGSSRMVDAMNHMRCPLTAVAAQYTADRADNFDIYLPVWLARYNKHIVGGLFVGGLLFSAWQWLRWSGSP